MKSPIYKGIKTFNDKIICTSKMYQAKNRIIKLDKINQQYYNMLITKKETKSMAFIRINNNNNNLLNT